MCVIWREVGWQPGEREGELQRQKGREGEIEREREGERAGVSSDHAPGISYLKFSTSLRARETFPFRR